ncbi:hypothetical protein TNCV_3909761 [Trichonephila clavipes]|nr:hypothetical protein TNCV_3909761 [Trichonephila clavipes]
MASSNVENCGFQMLNYDEIVTSVQEETDPVHDETDEDEDNNNESSKGPSNAHVLSALETTMFEQQSAVLLNYYCSRESEASQGKNEADVSSMSPTSPAIVGSRQVESLSYAVHACFHQ